MKARYKSVVVLRLDGKQYLTAPTLGPETVVTFPKENLPISVGFDFTMPLVGFATARRVGNEVHADLEMEIISPELLRGAAVVIGGKGPQGCENYKFGELWTSIEITDLSLTDHPTDPDLPRLGDYTPELG